MYAVSVVVLSSLSFDLRLEISGPELDATAFFYLELQQGNHNPTIAASFRSPTLFLTTDESLILQTKRTITIPRESSNGTKKPSFLVVNTANLISELPVLHQYE